MKTQAKRLGWVVFFSLILLGGCGQKGPLTLPAADSTHGTQQR